MSRHYHVFKNDTQYFVVDTRYVVLAEISKEQFLYLDNLDMEIDEMALILGMDKAGIVSIKKQFDAIFEQGLFVSEVSEMSEMPDSETGFIAFTPVHACNFRCKYCFASHGENYVSIEKQLDEKRIIEALEYMIFKLYKDKKNIRIEMVGGGENLLAPQIIKCILDNAEVMCEKAGKYLDAFILTNGSIMSEEILSVLDRQYVGLGISLDGNKETNDYLRPDMKGEGTYDRVLSTVDYIYKNAKNRSVKNVWGLTVVTSKTKRLMDVLEVFKEHNVNTVQMRVVRIDDESELSMGGDNLSVAKRLYREFVDELKAMIEKGQIDIIKMILNDSDYFGKILVRILRQEVSNTRCMAGRNKVSIAANGEIYPCDAFVGVEKYKLGKIGDPVEDLDSDFARISVESRSVCSECWAKYMCGGDCHHNSYLHSGDIYEPQKDFCDLQKYLIELGLELANCISKKEDVAKELVSYVTLRYKINRFMH